MQRRDGCMLSLLKHSFDEEKEFVDNNENIQKVLKLYLEDKHFEMVKRYRPKYRKTKSGYAVPYGKSMEEFSIEVNNSLL